MKNQLTQKELFALADIMRAKYTKSGLNDGKFAEQTNQQNPEKFRFPIQRNHIMTLRNSLDIPPNRPRERPENDCGETLHLTVRVQTLEDQVAKLAVTVGKLMRELGA